MSEIVSVLAEECSRVGELLLGLSEPNFSRPTRCEPWNVKELTAHLLRSLRRIPTVLDAEPPDAVDTDSVSYWRSYDVPTDAPVIAVHAREEAATHESGHALAVAFDELWREASGRTRPIPAGSSTCGGGRTCGSTTSSRRACWRSSCTGWT